MNSKNQDLKRNQARRLQYKHAQRRYNIQKCESTFLKPRRKSKKNTKILNEVWRKHKSCESFESFRNQGTTGAVSSLGWPFCDAVQPHTWRSMQSNFCPPIELPAIAQWLSERMFAVSKCFGIQQKEQKRGLRPRTLQQRGFEALKPSKVRVQG